MVTEFYQKLYKLVESNFRGIEGVDWQPIDSHLLEWLEWPFEYEEIRRAVFNSDDNKASWLHHSSFSITMGDNKGRFG